MILYENNIQHQIKTGTNITITNTLNTQIDETKLSKLSTQDGTPTPSNPVAVNTVKGYRNLLNVLNLNQSYASVECVKNNDNSYTLDGTASSNYAINIIDNWSLTLPAGTYTLYGCADMGGKDTLSIELYSNSPNNKYFTDEGHGITFTIAEERTFRCYIAIKNTKQYDNVKVYPMLVEGRLKLPYKPYGNNYIYERFTGKNLFNKDDVYLKTGASFNGTDGNAYTTSSSNTRTYAIVKVLPSTKITISTQNSTYSNSRYYVSFLKSPTIEGGGTSSGWITSGGTLTTRSNTEYLGVVIEGKIDSTEQTSTQALIDAMNIQIEVGEQFTPYEAYKENTITIPLNNNEICGIGDYKDELVIDENGHATLTKRIGKYTLDTSQITLQSQYTNIEYGAFPKPTDFTGYDNYEHDTIYCNKAVLDYTQTWDTSQNINKIYSNAKKTNWWLGFSKGTGLDNIKTQLSGTVIYYPLATPTTIDLGYITPPTLFSGTNYISNSDTMDMYITFSSYLDINKNGLGYLNNVISASITEELNGEYKLVFDYPLDEPLSDEIQEERIVKCQVADGTQQCFVIKTVVKTYEKITATCTHLFYMLLNDIAEDIYPQNLSPKPFLDWVIARANYVLPFTTTSDVSVQKTARYVRKNLVEVILGEQENSMVNLFGIELKRNNWNIGLQSRVGADNGEKLIYGKNITGINVNIDTSEMYTRIMPVGYDGLLLPEKYVDATNINNYPYPKIGIIEFSEIRYDPEDESAYHTLDEAYTALRNAVQELYDNGINQPKVNVKVDWLELSKTEEYKQYSNLERVNLGDTIHAEIFGLNYTTRVVKTTYNPLNDRVEKFEIGTLQGDYASQMNKYEFDLQKINPASILDEAKDNATALITNAMGGYVYKTNEELYIMDNADPSQAVHVWRWNINGLGYSSTGINGTYGLAMTMDGAIVADFITTGVLRTSVIQGYDSLTTEVANNTGQISVLTQSVGEINTKLQDVADITTSAESEYAEVQLTNVNDSQPIQIKIRPMNSINISYLYPRDSLYPSDSLYMPDRIIKFTNTTTSEVFTYEIFDDLLYYDSSNYDEFYWDYDSLTLQITKKCEYDSSGNVVLKSSPVVETRPFPQPSEMYLSSGNYTISLPGYSNAYLSVRCMASNIYTTQFATRSELSQTANSITTTVAATYATQTEAQRLDSKIDQTATSITSSVSQTYETKTNATNSYNQLNSTITQTASEISSVVAQKVGNDEIISKINQTPETITISANKVNISGMITAINNDTSTTINGNKIKTGSITASQIAANTITSAKVNSSIITTSNFSAQNISASKITSGSLTSSNVKIGSWSLNGTGIFSSNGRLYPDYLGFKYNGTGGWTSQAWWRIGEAASDKRLKKNIKSLDDKFNGFFDDLKPVSFKWKEAENDKEHIGFIAQDILEAEKNNNLDLDIVYNDNNDYYNLDKRELIALNTWQIQMLKKEIQELKKEIEELKKGK